MGLRGPKAIDPMVRKNRGTYRPSDHPDAVARGGKVTCPKWLSPFAKKTFRKILRELQRLGIPDSIDGNLLVRYVHTWGQWLEAQGKLEAHGIITDSTDSRGRKRKGTQSPWLLIALKLSDQLLKMESLLGMSPAARQRLKTAPAEEAVDEGEQFFSGAAAEPSPAPMKIGV
jgi:P27 family predicted phage terminase small subunit